MTTHLVLASPNVCLMIKIVSFTTLALELVKCVCGIQARDLKSEQQYVLATSRVKANGLISILCGRLSWRVSRCSIIQQEVTEMLNTHSTAKVTMEVIFLLYIQTPQ